MPIRTLYGIRSLLAFLFSFFLGISSAWADTATYQILIDTDHNPATGCTLNTARGSFTGAERRLLTTVSFGNGPATVSGVQLQRCVGGNFGPPVWSSPGGWPVGQGTNADVIETLLPLSGLGGTTALRLGVVAEANGSLDTLFLSNGQGNGPSIDFPLPGGGGGSGPFDPPQAIPLLHPWAILGLALLLVGLAGYGLRRHRGLLLVLLLAATIGGVGLAWSAMQLDGQSGDWNGRSPLATDPRGDALGMADLLALYAKVEGQWLHLRLDAAGAGTAPTNQAPQVNAGADQTITLPTNSLNLAGSVTDDGRPNPPAQVNLTWSKSSGPGSVSFGNANSANTNAQFSASGTYVLHLDAFDGQLHGGDDVQISVNPEIILPPDPVTVAPPLDLTVATTTYAATQFLYTGANPIQTGVAEDMIEPKRAAVLRGRVLDRAGQAVSGTLVRIQDHPEFGQTLSRLDGGYDLAVNGGGYLTLSYQHPDYLPAQRQMNVPWQDWLVIEDVILIPRDPQVTPIDLLSSEPMQVAQGSPVSDGDGQRQATLLIPQGTYAWVYDADGSSREVNQLHLRFTEYTVGPTGPQAMPAPLPPTSAYTYALEISADEATTKIAGKDVLFSAPVPFYVDNFLNMPVGIQVPTAYYDREKNAWIPVNDGRVIKILSLTNGLADIDSDGDGLADNALWISDAEREKLGQLYDMGKTLWRVLLPHLSTYDCNYGSVPGAGGTRPQNPNSTTGDKQKPDSDKQPCAEGSVIECQSQILRESIPLVGTPFSLNYASDRVAGRKTNNTLSVPLSGASVPTVLKRIELEIRIAGQVFQQSFPPLANQTYSFQWDGRDALGRELQGLQPVLVRVGYVYDGFYTLPPYLAASFGATSGQRIPGNIPTRQEITRWQVHTNTLGVLDGINALPVSGWSLNTHHIYDPLGRILYQGDGSRRSAETITTNIIETVAGTGEKGYSGDGGPANQAKLNQPYGVAMGADGSLYIADTSNSRVRRVGSDGIITTVAGTGNYGYSGDGGPANQAKLNQPYGVAVSADGSLYIADTSNYRVRRVEPDGIITTVAGTGQNGNSGDGGPAVQAKFDFTHGVAVGADGSFYIANVTHHRVRRVGPDEIITAVAGTGQAGDSGDGGPASEAAFGWPHTVAVGADGSLYITDTLNHRVRRVAPDGIITTVAGTGQNGNSGDGGQANQASLNNPFSVAVGADGSLYIADMGNHCIRRVAPDGIITTVAGTGAGGDSGDGGPSTQAELYYPYGVAVGADGSLYIADTWNNRVRRVRQTWPFSNSADLVIPSADGSQVYRFNASGRHLDTRHTLTGAVVYQFDYDSAGRLIQITDGDGNLTRIERDPVGQPTAIVAPFGQRTILSQDANGYLASLTNPAGETFHMTYGAEGLLTSFQNPRGFVSTQNYDALGRLVTDTNADGGSQQLNRTELPLGYEVTRVTGELRAITHRIETLTTGDQRFTDTDFDGTQRTRLERTNGQVETFLPDTSTQIAQLGPDPRFGMQAPIVANLQLNNGGWLSTTITRRSATLAESTNPLSLQTLTDTVDTNGHVATKGYVAATRTTTRTSAAGRVQTQTIDSQGRPIQTQSGSQSPITLTYDAQGRRIRSEQDGRVTQWSYNAQGWLDTQTNPLGQTRRFQYDAAGRITQETRPDGLVIGHRYDANGNLIGLTPPDRPEHGFRYSALDQVAEYLPPDVGAGSNTTLYEHNLDRDLTRVDRPDGQALVLTYDAAGRLANQTLPNGNLSYSYNATTGQLAGLTDPDGGSLDFSYQGSLLTQVAWSGPISGQVDFGYDNDFRLASLQVNGANPITYQYDADSLLTQAGDLILQRDAQNGWVTDTALGNVTDSQSYNGFGELTSYSVQSGGTPKFATQFSRDTLGRISQKQETIGGVTTTYDYSYDLAGRLVEVKKDGVVQTTWGYDANGNRTHLNGVEIAHYDDQDRLLDYQGISYTYTANGELLTKTLGAAVTSYNYDVLGNLRQVQLPGGGVIDYVIDGKNRRIGKKLNGALVQGFLYQDQLKPLAELDGAGNLVSRFVYTTHVNVPDYMIRGGATYRLLTDHLGSPRLVVNAADGTIVQRLDYDAWGNLLLDTNPGFQPFGFAGGLYDRDTGLVRFGARDYEAGVGRWMAKETLLFNGGDTNLYVYSRNNPVNLRDANGLRISKCHVTTESLLLQLHYLNEAKEELEGIEVMIDALGIITDPILGLLGTLTDLPTSPEEAHIEF